MRDNIREEDIQDSMKILNESEEKTKVYKSFKFLEFEQNKRNFYQILMRTKDVVYLAESPTKNAYNNIDNQRFLFDVRNISLNLFLTPIYLSGPSKSVVIKDEFLEIDFASIANGTAFSIIDGHKRIKYFSQNWVDSETLIPVILTLNSTGEQDFTMFYLINESRHKFCSEKDMFLYRENDKKSLTEAQFLKNKSFVFLDALTKKFPNRYSKLSEIDYKQVEAYLKNEIEISKNPNEKGFLQKSFDKFISNIY